MLPCSVGRLLELYTWEPVFPRIEWGFHIKPPYGWEVESLSEELVEVDGHWYIYGSRGKPVKGTCNGTPYSAIIYWLYLGEELDSVHKLKTSCGSDFCLNPEHIYQDNGEVDSSDEDPVHLNYVKGPPVFVSKPKTRRPSKTGDTSRRMGCITRKVWFPDESSANNAVTFKNMRTYKCNMCNGWHHTHKGKLDKNTVRRRNRKMPYS